MRRAVILLALAAQPAVALTPPPPCDYVAEADMIVSHVQVLRPDDGSGDGAGITVERYFNATTLINTVYERRKGPVPALNDFSGTRVTFCATGSFLAIAGADPGSVNSALSATEFLRSKLQARKPVRFGDVQAAAKAVYGDVIVLRESDQTCACSVFFPDLKPAGMTAYGDRSDIE